MPDISRKDEDLLKRIREDYRYCLNYWRENREQMAIDMQYVSGDPWDEKDRKAREEKNRVCATPDELSQYLKQANNNLRQNKRAIKVSPKSAGARDQDASTRSDIIRGVEYKSNAQAAYTTAFEQCTESGMGFARITNDYIDDSGYEQEPRIRRIPNQFTVLPDPDAKEADFSDQEKCFVIDTVRDTDFARKYPKAKKTSFSSEDANTAPDFIKGKTIVICEAWYVEHKKRNKLQVESPEGPTSVYEDELPKDHGRKVLNERTTSKKEVVQYITNGLEILERNVWPGSWIPIAVETGEEIYVNNSGESKRIFLSLIRRARFPQKMLAYIASQELEEFGQAPRAPFIGYKGQFTDENWPTINQVPQAFIEVEPLIDQAGGQVLPLPTRPQFTPNVQAYQVSRESWRRAIQAAIGVTPLPTAAQRQNEKSGVALEKIQNAEAVGSFHFTDNHDRFLANIGRQINELITELMDTPRHVAGRKADGTHSLIPVAPNGQAPEGVTDPAQAFDPTRGEFDVTIETGPSYASQREEAADFADTLIKEIQVIAGLLPQGAAAQLLAMAVKLREIGPIGDQIVKIIEGDPRSQMQQGHAAMAKLQQQTQQMQEMQVELQKLQQEKAGHVVDNEYKIQLKKMDHALEIAKLDNARTIAEIQTKAQIASERAEQLTQVQTELHGAAHESALSAQEHAQDLQAGAQEHQQTLEQGDQAGAQQAALAQQAAENQPQPAA